MPWPLSGMGSEALPLLLRGSPAGRCGQGGDRGRKGKGAQGQKGEQGCLRTFPAAGFSVRWASFASPGDLHDSAAALLLLVHCALWRSCSEWLNSVHTQTFEEKADKLQEGSRSEHPHSGQKEGNAGVGCGKKRD